MAVMDASVYIALVNANEEAHTISWRWFQNTISAGETISAPAILLPEVAAALSHGVGDASLAQSAIQTLAHSKTIQILPITVVLAEQAAAVAANHRIRGCDAVYIAMAEQREESLVTLNHQQLERGSAVTNTHTPGNSK